MYRSSWEQIFNLNILVVVQLIIINFSYYFDKLLIFSAFCSTLDKLA
jgi:hypothetical protein